MSSPSGRFLVPLPAEAEQLPPLELPFQWNPGQHLSLVGTTGTGKSTLASFLLKSRQYVVVLKSKPDDVTYAGARRIRHAREIEDQRHMRFVLDPRYEHQFMEFAEALDRVWRHGGWTVYLDELLYLDRLGLRKAIERLLTQGRSKGITVAVGMQRPAQVTRFALSESTNVLTFGLEGRDAKEMGDATRSYVRDVVPQLGTHEFAWYRRPDRLWVGKLDPRSESLRGALVHA